MFPAKPRRPVTDRSQGSKRNQTIAEIMSLFQDDKGELDFDKIMETTHQINKIYHDFKPLIKPFMKK